MSKNIKRKPSELNKTRTRGKPENDAQSVWISFGLVFLVLAVYGYSILFDFVHFDDNIYVSQNPYVQNGLTKVGTVWAFTTFYANFWHPLTWLSLMMDTQIFGSGPFGHHLFSVIFHAANAILLFLLMKEMTGDLWKSAMVGALFAVHPLNVESVVWIAQRKDVLSAFFWILTLWSYNRYVRLPGFLSYLSVVLLFILGLMAKPMLVTIPFVLMILDYWPLKRNDSRFKLFVEKIPFLVISAGACVVAFMAQKAGGAIVTAEEIPVADRFINGLISYSVYVLKTIFPFNLSVFYPWPVHFPLWKIIGASAFLSAITAGAVIVRKSSPYIISGWLWFLGTLVPVIGLVKVGEFSMADRYAYIPLTGLYIILVWGGHQLISDKIPSGPYRKAFATLLIFLFALRAGNQTFNWRDGISLLEHSLRVTSSNYLAHNNLSVLFLERGDLIRAEEHLQYALDIKPGSDEVHNNMGALLARRGNFNKALDHYYRAIEINPGNSDSHYNIAGIYEKKGLPTEASSHYKKVINILPTDLNVSYRLSGCLIKMGYLKKAAEVLENAIRLDPNNAITQNKIKKLLELTAETESELNRMRKELDHRHDNYELCLQIGAFLESLGRITESISYYERSLSLSPDNPESLYGLASANAGMGEYDTALKILKKLSSLRPDRTSDIEYNISCLYARAGKPDESLIWLRSAIQKGFDNLDRIRSDEDLDSVRGKPGFNSLIRASFEGRNL